ncbi:membrane protein [Aeromicrobium flavum]|uniref:Membrane protein n=1 Tax=Aeromicrobium flavum TaxID=416568 RepID=A0A512HWU4_9ACTN|nr:DoxX family protein [Aeromicrobium flavum]GEO89917.1 membrane protein [Aeromicrobium flavum]
MSRRTDLALVAVPFAVSGVIHLVRPRVFEAIVPRFLPRHRELVLASGVAELVCAAAVVAPRTRRVGALASAGLLAAVFPANVQMAADVVRSRRASPAYKAGVVARLPLQWPLIRAALSLARASR